MLSDENGIFTSDMKGELDSVIAAVFTPDWQVHKMLVLLLKHGISGT